ncbi:MAG: energy-coupling factor ABC transporter permease, partial [Xenococcus sp. (in: cyanobacteria)]
LLGYYAFLAIPIGLFFQAVIFNHGGISTLGVNTTIMGVPAIAAYHLFRWREHIAIPEKIKTKIFAFLSGMLAIMLSATIFSAIAILTITPDLDATLEQRAIFISLISYGIQGLIEGAFTFMLISFLEQVKPELLKI